MNYSLQRLLVIAGLIAVPFYELIFKVFPYVRIAAADTRVTKELIALAFALAVGLLAVFQGTVKPLKNKFLLALPVFMLLSLFMSPRVSFLINNVEVGDLFFWKPFVQVLCYLLLVIALASIHISVRKIITTMATCGTVMAAYVILQYFGFDQFWMQREGDMFTQVTGRLLGGNLGQPTVVASFIVMLVPIAFHLKKYFSAATMVISLLLIKSEMSLFALVFVAIIYFVKHFKSIRKLSIAIIAVGILVAAFGYFKFDSVRSYVAEHSNGRIGVWKEIIMDIKQGPIIDVNQDYSFTGAGLGRFPFIFPDKHKSIFQQAHNDPLEFTYNCGIIGLLLLFGAIFVMGKGALNASSGLAFALLMSFAAIFFASLGGFPFQLGAHQFYSAVVVGLLHNRQVIRRK